MQDPIAADAELGDSDPEPVDPHAQAAGSAQAPVVWAEDPVATFDLAGDSDPEPVDPEAEVAWVAEAAELWVEGSVVAVDLAGDSDPWHFDPEAEVAWVAWVAGLPAGLGEKMPMSDSEVVRSIAFPFSIGQTSFPQEAVGPQVIFYAMVSLILTGKTERVMHCDLGTNVHRFLFDNLDALTAARIAADVTAAISNWLPEAQILSVKPVDIRRPEGNSQQTIIVIDIIYRVADQVYSQQVPVTVTTP